MLVVLGLAMLASTASASTYIKAFEMFLAAPGPDGLINMVANQVVSLAEPIILGLMLTLVDYAWENGSMDMGGQTMTFPMVFGLAGIGNKKQLMDSMVQFTHYSMVNEARKAYCGTDETTTGGDPIVVVYQACIDKLFPWDTTGSPEFVDNVMSLMAP